MVDALRLLLVEDDDDIALVIQKTLERAGHALTRCRSAADAVTMLRAGGFDLAVLDHHLPDMAGLDLLQALQRENLRTPALMVTAYGDEQLATRVLHAGALDYVVKDPALAFLAELPKRVAEAVHRHRLQQFNRLLVEALESARDGVLISDRDGTILHVNRAVERMTGYDRGEMLGQKTRLFKSGAHPPEVYAGIWQAVMQGTSWQGELTNRRKDGNLVEVWLTVSPILEGKDDITHFVAIYRDLSERKHMERQLAHTQKMQSVGTLASGVAHEFNNLLAGISGYAALGLEEALPVGPLREYLQQIVTLSERMATLTRQLLAFARRPPVSRRALAVEEVVRGTAEFVHRTARIEVQVEVEPGPAGPLHVDADSGQLQQALVNLALNARDALKGKTTPMIFRLRPVVLTTVRPGFPESVPAGDYAVLQVVDSGAGMTPEVLSQSLDPFFTTRDVGQGTGLGLPVVFGIVHAHQGYMAIDTAPGQGTCVSLFLPRCAKPATA